MDQLAGAIKNLEISGGVNVFILGGAGSNSARAMHVYSDGVWNHCENLQKGRSYFATVLVNDDIYAIGGRDARSNECLTSIECFNLHTHKWSRFSLQLIVPRSEFGAVVSDDIIYCVGGFDDGAVKTMERINLKDGTITTDYCEIPGPKRWGCGVVLCNGKIFVTGGHFYENEPGRQHRSYKYFNDVEVYDIGSRLWSTAQSMICRRSYHSVTAMNDSHIYAVGGFGRGTEVNGGVYRGRLDSIERYDLRAEQWTMVTTMPLTISNLVVCSYQKKLIILGGMTGPKGQTESLDTVYEYDTVTEQWTTGHENAIVKSKMQRGRHSFCAVITQD